MEGSGSSRVPVVIYNLPRVFGIPPAGIWREGTNVMQLKMFALQAYAGWRAVAERGDNYLPRFRPPPPQFFFLYSRTTQHLIMITSYT